MWTDKKMQLHVRMETIEMNERKGGKDKRGSKISNKEKNGR
jgi:hypothetical protein